MIGIISLAAGVCLLLFGRRLYWLFIGVVGFIYGLELARLLLGEHSPAIVLAAALMAGIIGSVLAVFLQRAAIALAGFFAGSYLAFTLMGYTGWGTGTMSRVVSLVLGILCALVFNVFFDWAIIIMSSLLGSHLIVQFFQEGSSRTGMAVYAVLTIAGIAVQAGLMHREKP